MSLTGTTDTGWILRRWSNTDEYREVSEDGTEENTKTQKRTNSTFVIFKEVCGPTSFSSDNGTNVASPSGKLCGTTFTASGTWTVSDDDIEEHEKGSNSVTNTQILKKFTDWADYTIP